MTVTNFNIFQQITSVRLASIANYSGIYNNGQINTGVGATLISSSVGALVVDGINANVGDRILLKDQTNANENGIYIVRVAGSSITKWLLERSSDFQSIEQLKVGQYFSVGAGNTLAGSMYILCEPLPSVVGLGDFVFVDVASGVNPPGPYYAVANHLSETTTANKPTLLANIGLGSSFDLIIDEADFSGGLYTLTNPCPNYIFVNAITPGNAVRLPAVNDAQSFITGQGPVFFIQQGFEGIDVQDSNGAVISPLIAPACEQFVLQDNALPQGLWFVRSFVSTLNNLSGAFSITSNDASININTSTGNVDLSVAQGAATLQTAYDNGNGEIALSANKTFSVLNNTILTEVNGVTTPSTGTNTIANYRVLGWTFTPVIDMTVSALQYDDALFTSAETRPAGIYVKNTGNLLGSATIAQTDPLDGTNTYRTKTLVTPIQLNAGEQYVYATVVPANQSDHTNSNAVPDANITITQRAELPSSASPLPLSFPQSFTNVSNYVHVGSFQYESTVTNDSFNVNDATTNASVFLEVDSTTKGTIPVPKMTISQRNAIATPTAGLSVVTTDSSPTRYSVYDGTNWRYLGYLNDNVITHQLWVNAATGNDANDGGLNAPFASYNAARLAAVSIANSTNFVLINIIGDQSITGDFVISPYTVIDQHHSGTISITNNISLDTAFAGLSIANAYVVNCRFIANAMFLNYSTAELCAVTFENCEFPQVPDVTIQSDPATVYGGYTIFKGTQNPIDSVFQSSFNVQDSSVAMFDMLFNTSAPAVTATSTHAASLTLDNCASFGSPVITSNNPGIAFLSMINCSAVTVSMVGVNAFLQTDNNSTSNISLSGGALLSNVNYTTQSNSLMVNPSSFVPSYYTPTAPASNVSPNSILSHLNGIDLQLATIATPATTIDGMTINTSLGINGPLSPIISSHETRVGNLVTGTVRFGFNAQLNNCSITLNKSYGSAFTLTTQANGSGCVYKTPTAAIGDGLVAEVAANTTLGLSIKMVVATTGVDYIMEVNFTYQVT